VKCNIQTVYQIPQCGTNENEDLIKSLWDGYNNDFEQLSIQYGQQQNIPVAFYPNTYSPQINSKIYLMYLYIISTFQLRKINNFNYLF